VPDPKFDAFKLVKFAPDTAGKVPESDPRSVELDMATLKFDEPLQKTVVL
jgi:hypothetical protein